MFYFILLLEIIHLVFNVTVLLTCIAASHLQRIQSHCQVFYSPALPVIWDHTFKARLYVTAANRSAWDWH